jgi:hypothetical protein
LTAADPANDVIPIVDVSDTTMAASGTTKKISVNNILGASGTATLASATITGDLTVATNTLKTTSGNVGIGTVTPDIFGRFYTRSVGFDSSGSTALQINGTSYGGIDIGAAGVRTFSMTSSATDANISTVTNIPINFGINGATKMTLNTAGNLAFVNGLGIDFSLTPGTGTSELLNDYEEGVWTPVATGLTNVGAVTYTATYTKIGRVVYINLKVSAVTSTTSVANTTYFSGLPFNPAQNSTVTAVNEGNITSLGVGLIATGSNLFAPSWTAVQNATLSGFYYV